MFFRHCVGNYFRRGALPATYAANLAGSFATNARSTANMFSRRPSMIEPRWTNSVGNKEFEVSDAHFQCASSTWAEGRGRCQRRSAPGADEFAWSDTAAIASAQTKAMMREQKQEYDCHPHPEKTPPAFHRESASRACCKLRSLFNSANSRKHSCSFCQAATPSRVACSAPLGT